MTWGEFLRELVMVLAFAAVCWLSGFGAGWSSGHGEGYVDGLLFETPVPRVYSGVKEQEV